MNPSASQTSGAPRAPTSSSGLPMLPLVAAIIAAPNLAWAQSFFISTEKIVAPGQPAEIKLEARNIDALELRLYRVEDPARYFDKMADLHRPKEDVQKPRPPQLQALSRGLQLGLDQLRSALRRPFTQRAKDALRELAPAAVETADRGARSAPVRKKVPLLEAHLLVDAWTESLPPREGWYYGRLTVPAHKPGVYVVEAVHDTRVAHTVLIVSEIALITKQSADALLVWTVDPTTGEPKSGAQVAVKVRGELREKKTTDADGLARFRLTDSPTPIVYGALKDSFTVLDPRFFRANVQAPRVYVFTERPVYRAGQTIHVKGFARAFANETYRLPQTTPGTEIPVKIIDARGRVHAEKTATLSDRGSFEASFELPDDPAYGTWTAIVDIDEGRHGGEFKVLAFEKPEVLLRVRLDKPTLRSGDRVGGDIRGRYFYGSPYPGAQVRITVTRTRFYVPWYVDTDYAWYYSEAEYRNTERDVVHEAQCRLDAEGSCPFEFVATDDSDDFTYVVEAVAQDPNGRTVVGVAKATVTRGAFRLHIDQSAVVVEPGAAQTIQVRAVDYEGLPIDTDVRVVVRARRPSADGVVDIFEALAETRRTGASGVAELTIDPQQRGYYEIVATARDDANNKIRAEGFLFAATASKGVALQPSELSIVTDKKSYFTGDRALVLLLAPAASTPVLFTVEGGGLYEAKVVRTSGHATVVEVPITARQSPNFYLSATAVIAGELYHRAQSVIVPPKDKILQVEVSPSETSVQPGASVDLTVHVTDADARPVANAEVALAVVDEAIYAISPEIAVPLEAFFHPRKRNDVRLADSLTFRFFGRARNALGPSTAQRALFPFAFGALKPQADDRDEFKDTAGWWPALTTDAQGRATVSVTLPDNLTTWRATAKVMTAATQVGAGIGRIVAKKPVVVRLALPRLVNEGDTGTGGLLVQNLTSSDETFTVGIELDGDGLALGFGERASTSGGNRSPPTTPLTPQTVQVPAGEQRRLPIAWRAAHEDDVQVRVVAEGGGHRDQVVRAYRVGPWVDRARVTATGDLEHDGDTVARTLRLPASVDPSKATLTITLVNSPLAAARSSLSGLIAFPYGCTEQTMSRFVPLLVAKAALDRWKMPMPEEANDVAKFVAAGIARLAQLQRDDGSWGWFSEGTDPWMTAWVVEGLAEAQALGAQVDAELVARGAEALRQRLTAQPLPPPERAFAVYALAKAQDPSPAMVQRLLDDDDAGRLPSSALAYVLMAARLIGDRAMITVAERRLLSTKHRQVLDDGTVRWCADSARDPARHPVECTALAVRALSAASSTVTAASVHAGSRYLMRHFDGTSFGSTRHTALTVRALAAAAKEPTSPTLVRLVIDDADYGPTKVAATGVPVTLQPSLVLKKHSLQVRLEQEGPGQTFAAFSLQGPDRQTVFEPQRRGLSIRREYRRLDGQEGRFEAGRSSRKFEAGDPVLVVLEVNASRPLEHVLIEAPHPAGLAPVLRDGGLKVVGVQRQPPNAHREHRPDRTAFFLRRLQGKVELSYLMRATLPGRYRTLPARGEAMYLPDQIFGRSLSTDVQVVTRP